MEIGPIFRALMHNKSRFWLVTLEVALTLAIVANCVNMMLDMRHEYLRPSGYDEENLIAINTEPFAPDFEDEEFVDTIREEDLRRLEAVPGVRGAIAINQVPLSGSGSSTGRKPFGSDIDTTSAPYFAVTEGVLQTFGVELIAGRDFIPSDFEEPEEGWDGEGVVRNVILNEVLAEKLFPEGSAVGERIQSRGGERVNLVVGLVGTMHGSWPTSSIGQQTMLFPGKPGSGRRVRFLVRTEPGAVDAVFAELEGVLREVHPGSRRHSRNPGRGQRRELPGQPGGDQAPHLHHRAAGAGDLAGDCRSHFVLGHPAHPADRHPAGAGCHQG
jgi:putative ABC transport system permease protein